MSNKKLAPENNLKQFREDNFLTQYELAVKLNIITAQAIGNIETRRANPRMKTKRAIAEFFNVPVRDIFPGEVKEKQRVENFSIAAA